MRKQLPEQYRIRTGKMATNPNNKNGAFVIPCPAPRASQFKFLAICSEGGGWEHVAVRVFDDLKKKNTAIVPSWEDLEYVKSLFWEDEETVVQFHPAKNLYVNTDKNCLHLWRCNIKPPYHGFPIPHPLLAGLFGFEMGDEGRLLMGQMTDEVQEETRRRIITGDWSQGGQIIKN